MPRSSAAGYFTSNELPRRKQRGIKNFKFCHSALDAESSSVFWIPASAGMTNSPQAAGEYNPKGFKRKRNTVALFFGKLDAH